MASFHKNFEIQRATLNRLPLYYCFLTKLKNEHHAEAYISATTISNSLKLNPVQVRKDLASVRTNPGVAHKGFELDALINELETYLRYNNFNEAIIVGVGKLGRTLLSYEGFQNYGLNIVAGFGQY